jgi:hypothetical protein
MTTLTSSATLSIGAGTTVVSSVSVPILPALGAATGKGRLIHPTLGTYDYLQAPKEWTNIDGDLIVPPVWSSSKTLLGAANTLWQGHIRDIVCEEKWTGELTASAAHLRMLLAMWQNPPDPDVGFVSWYPNYTSPLGFKVILVGLQVGGQDISLNWIMRSDWVASEIVLRLRVVDRIP